MYIGKTDRITSRIYTVEKRGGLRHNQQLIINMGKSGSITNQE